MGGEEDREHEFIVDSVGHVRAIDQMITVQTDLVRCTCGGPPAIGVAVGGWRDEEGVAYYSTALLDPAAALSFANTILAAVQMALGASSADQAVAEILRDVDMDSALSELLDGGFA